MSKAGSAFERRFERFRIALCLLSLSLARALALILRFIAFRHTNLSSPRRRSGRSRERRRDRLRRCRRCLLLLLLRRQTETIGEVERKRAVPCPSRRSATPAVAASWARASTSWWDIYTRGCCSLRYRKSILLSAFFLFFFESGKNSISLHNLGKKEKRELSAARESSRERETGSFRATPISKIPKWRSPSSARAPSSSPRRPSPPRPRSRPRSRTATTAAAPRRCGPRCPACSTAGSPSRACSSPSCATCFRARTTRCRSCCWCTW